MMGRLFKAVSKIFALGFLLIFFSGVYALSRPEWTAEQAGSNMLMGDPRIHALSYLLAGAAGVGFIFYLHWIDYKQAKTEWPTEKTNKEESA